MEVAVTGDRLLQTEADLLLSFRWWLVHHCYLGGFHALQLT